MGQSIECFWNISFAVMIITAILGNIAVLYIVISMACLDVEQIMFLEKNHFPSLNCYSRLSWEIRELNKILLMVQRPATFLYIFTCSQRIKQLDRFCTDLYRLITDLFTWEYHLQIVRSQDKSKLNEPTNYFHSSNWD